MGTPKIEKIEDIAASLPEWQFLKDLPERIGSFVKTPGRGIVGQVLYIISYVDAVHHRSLDLTYTKETFDYIPVKVVGLHTFRDERYFCRDKEKFASIMQEHLPNLLKEISVEHITQYSYEAKDMHFPEWDYWKQLPKRIGGFEQYITPENPVTFINGSIIFLDYTNFEEQSTLYFLFNGFRTEVFGEMLQNNVPVTTPAFTVPEEDNHGRRKEMNPDKILPRFAQLLEQHFTEHIDKLGKRGFFTI